MARELEKIAHDFNNLLTGILGYASLLKMYLPEGGEGHEAAGHIERSARRASELTRQLLAYSRSETPPEDNGPDR
jgi:two-component system cell cycle sensor histidine kinase/response regulator CckA